MAEILSQAEIDELLNALASGVSEDSEPQKEVDLSKVKVYDFKTANKFPKDQVRTLNVVFQAYGQLLSNFLISILQTTCDVEILSVEEQTFSEFNNSLPSPVVLGIVDIPPLAGSILLQWSSEITYAVIGRLFGGGATHIEPGKALTEIELAVIERVMRQTMRLLDEAWAKVIQVKSSLNRIEISSQFAQIVDLNEPVAIITLSVSIGGEEGLLVFCLPHMAIETVAKQLTTQLWYSGAQTRMVTSMGEEIEEKLLDASVTLRAVFDDTVATVRDVAHLQVGDVIQLSQKADDPITVMVQNMPKFKVSIGTKGTRYAVKVLDVIRGGDEDE